MQLFGYCYGTQYIHQNSTVGSEMQIVSQKPFCHFQFILTTSFCILLISKFIGVNTTFWRYSEPLVANGSSGATRPFRGFGGGGVEKFHGDPTVGPRLNYQKTKMEEVLPKMARRRGNFS